ncbi:hypothetical protein ACNF5A_004241 [Kosakonia cowanii]|jgi:hypothetical protein|uniref:hypothetical protein n=1 Tax=Kosakonia cowanii TaxID=208223 RepID=UPI00289F4790|nr:hypothetical protein [Kosakonia cowanii]
MPIGHQLKKVALYLIVTFSLFSGSYVLGGIKIYPPLLFAVIGFALTILNFRIPKNLVTQLVFVAILSGLCCLSFFISQNSDFLFIIFRYITKACLIPLGCCLLIRHLVLQLSSSNYLFSQKILRSAIVFALCFQLAFTIAQLTLPAFRAEFNSIIDLTSEWKTLSEQGHFRATGLGGLSIYDTSICYGLLYFLFYEWCFSLRYKDNIKFVTVSLIIITLSLIAGRSGFILVFTIFFFYYLYSPRKTLYTLFFCASIIACVISIIAILGEEKFDFFMRFVFEPIYNFIDTGSFKTESTNELLDSYLFIPWDVPVFTGFGFWAQPDISNQFHFLYKTDSGIILNYIAFGIWGLIFIFAYTVNFIYNYTLHLKLRPGLIRLGLILSFSLLIFSFVLKGPIFFSERVMMAFYLWILFNTFTETRKS